MKTEVACVCLSLGILGATLVGCGDDDFIEELPSVDASTDAATSSSGASDAATEAGETDAGNPAALEQCQNCIFQDCGPALIECLLDETCRELATCALTNNCLEDLASCVPLCIDSVGSSPGEVIEQLLMLQRIATSCTSCFDICQDAIPGGGLPGGGFPGAGGPN